MKILVVTLFALETNTSVTISNYGIISGLLSLSHDVTVLMPEINENLSYYDDTYDMNGINIKRITNNNVGSRIASSSSNSSGMKKKAIGIARTLYNKFQIFDRTQLLIKEAAKFDGYEEYFDLVISTSDPKTSHLFVKEMIKSGLKYGKWIQHWGDPLAGDISKTNIYPEMWIKKIERNILKDADKVIYVSPFTLDTQRKRYKDMAFKMAFVPLPCTETSEIVMDVQKPKSHLKIVYLGDYSSNIRNILPLYNVCKKLSNIDLTIAGNTDLKLEETENIHIFPRVPQSKVQELERTADVLMSIGNLKGTQIPGKIYYAASSGKPMIFAIDGDQPEKLEAYLASFNRFHCCRNEEESLGMVLEELSKKGSSLCETPQCLLPKNIAKKIIEE